MSPVTAAVPPDVRGNMTDVKQAKNFGPAGNAFRDTVRARLAAAGLLGSLQERLVGQIANDFVVANALLIGRIADDLDGDTVVEDFDCDLSYGDERDDLVDFTVDALRDAFEKELGDGPKVASELREYQDRVNAQRDQEAREKVAKAVERLESVLGKGAVKITEKRSDEKIEFVVDLDLRQVFGNPDQIKKIGDGKTYELLDAEGQDPQKEAEDFETTFAPKFDRVNLDEFFSKALDFSAFAPQPRSDGSCGCRICVEGREARAKRYGPLRSSGD
jgi:hypothetical protein